MFEALAEIILNSKIKKENLNRHKSFLAWNQVKTLALVLNEHDKINKSALDKFIDSTEKLVSVFYVETGSKTASYADWHCFSKQESSFLGLPRKKVEQVLKKKKYDLVINTSGEQDFFSCAVTAMLPATLKCGSGKKSDNLDLIIKKVDPYHVIDYLNEVIKYLKMIRG